ncbi:hypothetical protein ABZ722_11725 [Streptomyces longwoodensis]|uniref:hypothetical protein n=1 Tax=Streptomyces longwoodensis TaxID=68231 RepID=UPI0033D2DB3B
MATTSRVPDAIDALVGIVKGLGLEDVRVVDGPDAVNATEKHRIHIGWSPAGEAAVTLQQQWNAAGARTRDEQFTIACYAESRGGDKDMSARRRRLFDMVAAIEQAIRATAQNPQAPDLNGTVLWAELSTGDLIQNQADGAFAGLAFSVTCRARI